MYVTIVYIYNICILTIIYYRIIWAIAVFVSLGCAIVLMKMAWNYYATHPTLTVIESTHHGIWNYPFPAITVCNINRISYNLTKKFVESM